MRRLCGIVLALCLLASPALAQTELDVSKIRLGTQPCVVLSGANSPEGAVVGSVCDVYIRTNGTSFSTILYVKASGTATNTGWVAASAGTGTVSSVGLALPTDVFDISGSPVTTSGTLTGAFDSQTAKYFFAAPNASAGTPSFRAMVASDVPTLNQNTTGTAAAWTTARLLAGNSVTGAANVAFANKFIVQGTTDSGLTGAQFLGALGTGLLKNTTTTGVLTIAAAGDLPTHTHAGGDITSGLVGLSVGGTNANLTASNGGIFYSTATAGAILSGIASAGRHLRSGNSAAPTWSTNVWPDTATSTRVLYATGTNTIGESANLTFDGTTLTVSGNLSTSNVSNHLIPSATDTYDLGSASRLWRNGFLSTMNALVFAETTQTLFGGYSTIGKQVGDFAADVSSAATTINFGEAMTPNDWLLVRAHDTGGTIKAEYIRVLTLVSGTTYNVTRDLAAAHATDPAWAAGTPWLCLGAENTGRIDLIAVDGKPRMVMTQQGSAYNTQNDRAIVGNLNTYYGYASDLWGAAFGDYTANNVTIEPTNGVRFRSGSTVLGQLSSTTWTLGNTASEHLNLTSTAAQFKDGSTVLTDISGGNVTVGQVATSQSNVYITGGAVALRNNTTERIKLNADGSGFLASTNISWTTAGVLTAGGWTVGATDLKDAAGTVGMSSAVTAGDDIRFWAGDATPSSAEFRVTEAGALTATSATITGAITATSGSFTGSVLIGTGGNLRQGQTAYDTGTGFWLGDSSGAKFSLGSATGAKLTWNGSVLSSSNLSVTNTTGVGAIDFASGDAGFADLYGGTDNAVGFYVDSPVTGAVLDIGYMSGLSANVIAPHSGSTWQLGGSGANAFSAGYIGTIYGSTWSGNLNVTADFSVASTKFTVDDATGNIGSSGSLTLSASGSNITVNGGAFSVTGSTGAVAAGAIAGDTLALTDQPFARVYKSADQTGFTDNTYAVLSWPSEDSDALGMHDVAVNNSRITVPTGQGGLYLVGGNYHLDDNANQGGGYTAVMFRKNAAGSASGGTYLCEVQTYGPGAANNAKYAPSCVVTLAASDYVEVFAKADQGGTGATLTVQGGAVTDSHFTLTKLF